MRITELLGGVKTVGKDISDRCEGRISCHQGGVISKLKDFGSTVVRKLSDEDVEEQRAETRALWEPSGDV